MWACEKLYKLRFFPVSKCKKIKHLLQHNPVLNKGLTRCLSASAVPRGAAGEKYIYPSTYSDVVIPDVSFTQFIFDSQEKYADKMCLVNGETGQSWTHHEIRSETLRLASALSRLGVSQGDTVALISPNCPEFAISLCAIIHLGATVSTFNVSYTKDEICHQLINSDSAYVICHEDKLFDTLEASKDNKNIRQIFVIGKESEGVLSIQKLIKNDDGKGIPSNIQINPAEDVAILPYSSGTTGLPKGVMVTHRNVISNIVQVLHPDVTLMKYATDNYQETFIGWIPLYHIYGMVCIMCHTLITGARMVSFKDFDPLMYSTAIGKYKATILHVVPPLLGFLNSSDLVTPESLSSVKAIICGAAPLGKTLLSNFCKKFGTNVTFLEGYGMTESSPVTHLSRKNCLVVGSCGPALPNTWTKIVDLDTNLPLKPGGEGELCIKGPQVMKGYYKNEEATKNTVDEEGWLHTGDIARMDEDQNVFIVDRLKELIKVKGLQVAPAELENLLLKHTAIADVAVTGIPDEKAGELPRAFVVPFPGTNVTEEDIKEFVAKKVARHKHLNGGVKFVKEIPKSAAGKILRRQLKKMAMDDYFTMLALTDNKIN